MSPEAWSASSNAPTGIFPLGGEEFVVVLPDGARMKPAVSPVSCSRRYAPPPFRGTICRTKASSPPPSASPAGAVRS